MMNDLFLVLGLIVSALAIPSVISAFSESRTPRAAAIMIMIGGGLVALAVTQQPGGYSFGEIPAVFTRVVAHYLR
ncbi:MAG: hypothetical protein WBN04_05800 [Paracoccaceae bacterium]